VGGLDIFVRWIGTRTGFGGNELLILYNAARGIEARSSTSGLNGTWSDPWLFSEVERRATTDYHPSEGASKNR
jgi:hypothetical protein